MNGGRVVAERGFFGAIAHAAPRTGSGAWEMAEFGVEGDGIVSRNSPGTADSGRSGALGSALWKSLGGGGDDDKTLPAGGCSWR